MTPQRLVVASALTGALVITGVGIAVAETPPIVHAPQGKALGHGKLDRAERGMHAGPIVANARPLDGDDDDDEGSSATTDKGSSASTTDEDATETPSTSERIAAEPSSRPTESSSTTAVADQSGDVTRTPPSVPAPPADPAPQPTETSTAPASPSPTPTAPTSGAPVQGGVPQFDHVVVVVEENHSYSEVANQPYLNSLIAGGANFTAAHAETHPSQPNYISLWSGSNQGVTDNGCTTLSADNLGAQLLAAGKTVAGYSEGLPGAGSNACTAGAYAKKHNPIATFAQTSSKATNLPFSAFPSDYSTLPQVSFVVPNLNNDMHDGSVATGDAWLKNNLSGYASWAAAHNSLLIVTFDEDDKKSGNHILNVFSGAHVKPGAYSESVSHYSDLATIEAAFGLSPLTSTPPITDVWQ